MRGAWKTFFVEFGCWFIVERRILSRFGLAYLDIKSLSKSLSVRCCCVVLMV